MKIGKWKFEIGLKWSAAAMIAAVAIVLAADITFSDLNPTDADTFLDVQRKTLAAINANTTAVNANGGGGGGAGSNFVNSGSTNGTLPGTFYVDTIVATNGLQIGSVGSTNLPVTGNVLANGAVFTNAVTANGLFTQPPHTPAALNIDWGVGNMFPKTIGADSTFTFSNATAGTWITVKVTASGAFTATWPTVTWAGGSPPTQTASKTDFYTFYFDGTSYWGSAVQNF